MLCYEIHFNAFVFAETHSAFTIVLSQKISLRFAGRAWCWTGAWCACCVTCCKACCRTWDYVITKEQSDDRYDSKKQQEQLTFKVTKSDISNCVMRCAVHFKTFLKKYFFIDNRNTNPHSSRFLCCLGVDTNFVSQTACLSIQVMFTAWRWKKNLIYQAQKIDTTRCTAVVVQINTLPKTFIILSLAQCDNWCGTVWMRVHNKRETLIWRQAS